MLAFYVPIIIYKILSKTGWYSVNETLKTVIVSVITLASVTVSIIASVKINKEINRKGE